jgi:hypothetical protein
MLIRVRLAPLKYSSGTLGHELRLRSIGLYGQEAIPQVRRLLTEAPERTERAAVAP